MPRFNFGGLALSIVSGVLGAVSATAAAGVTNGHALSGAAIAGAATGTIGFLIPTTHNGQSGTVQIAQVAQTVAALAPLLPAQAQSAAQRIMTQVVGALETAPTATPAGPAPTATGGAPSADQWTQLMAKLDAQLAKPTQPAPPAGS